MIQQFLKNLASKFGGIIFFCLAFFIPASHAVTYPIPSTDEDVIGQVEYVAPNGSTLLNLAQEYNIGHDQISQANPGVHPAAPIKWSQVQIPSSFILPALPRRGIVINLPEMRLYYYTETGVKTYPVGIGVVGKTMPTRRTQVVRKKENPVWIPTPAEKEWNAKQGINLPHTMPAGPDNPLGPYAIYLGIPTFLIHSTIFPESVGTRASFGCIRMHESDIKDFFNDIAPGTPVAIINMPTKVGWERKRLYLEIHEPLEEHDNYLYGSFSGIASLIQDNFPNNGVVLVDWEFVNALSHVRDGVPHEVGFAVN